MRRTCGCGDASSAMQSSQFSYVCAKTESSAARRWASTVSWVATITLNFGLLESVRDSVRSRARSRGRNLRLSSQRAYAAFGSPVALETERVLKVEIVRMRPAKGFVHLLETRPHFAQAIAPRGVEGTRHCHGLRFARSVRRPLLTPIYGKNLPGPRAPLANFHPSMANLLETAPSERSTEPKATVLLRRGQ